MYLMHGFGRVWNQKYVQTLRCLCFSEWNGQSSMSFSLYFLLRLSFVLFFFSQRSWWTPRQRHLISNGPSSQPPNPRCVIPAFAVSSVLLTRIVWRPGIFVGFQLFLCYFGYKRVPYTAANWQIKGRLERSWDSGWIGSRCFDLFRQPWSWSNRLCTFFVATVQPENKNGQIHKVISWGAVARVFYASSVSGQILFDLLTSERNCRSRDTGKKIFGTGQKYPTNIRLSLFYYRCKTTQVGKMMCTVTVICSQKLHVVKHTSLNSVLLSWTVH